MAPPGLLPQSVTVVMQGDLVNAVKPGDRGQMIGIYKLIGGAQSKEKGIFKPYFLCLSAKMLSEAMLIGSIPSKLPFNES
jgi:DNA replication licensing factor MCM3